MAKLKYRTITNHDWITPTTRRHHMACCDCGLVHLIDFRIAQIEYLNGRKFNKPHVQFRAARHNRATAGRRNKASLHHIREAIATAARKK